MLSSFAVGLLVGVLFRLLRFPVPAPASWAGVAGVAGLTAGYLLMEWIARR